MENQIQEASGSFGPSLRERQSRREWILGRIATLLGHYWREDDPSELNEAMGRDWADILEGLPQDAISKACRRYLTDEPRRKPTPGAIYAMAREYVPRPIIVASAPEPEPERQKLTAERAAQIMEEIGFRPQRFGGTDD